MKKSKYWSGWQKNANKKQVNKFIQLVRKNQEIDKQDGYQLCFYRENEWSVYLAVYDGKLTWTLSKHDKESDGTYDEYWDNVYDIDFDDDKHIAVYTSQDLKELAKIALQKSINEYQGR
ncbi:MAG: hypothetical protein FWE22_01600 [Firmicutes bacterium]|nr:hypothetical protein [Bacillota bacterium]